MRGNFVAYYRVSTDRQGRSGLGLEAQREAVRTFLDGGIWQLRGEFTEVESGKVNERPELGKALERCRLTGATLVVAKLDRLARNARFLLSAVEGSGEGGVIFCDLPHVPAGPVGKFLVTRMAGRRAGGRADQSAHTRSARRGEDAWCRAGRLARRAED